MRVSVRNLTKRFGTTTALKDISLEIGDHELFFLLGPSGCGKTTLLRTVAGFYQPDEGDLLFGNRSMRGVPAHQRNAGMVFQNYALWPHMTVEQNVAYGLDVRGVTNPERRDRVRETLGIVQMEPYAARTPNQLSGGQQQRVALARALVIRPDVLLLDEPLSNLDARLRLEMREEIHRIHDQLKITTLYVTHDQKEALSLADRMAVLRDGRVEQVDGPREVYRTPANRFVADFIGETNWFAGEVASASVKGVETQTEIGLLNSGADGSKYKAGQKVWVGFRPEAVRLGAEDHNHFVTTIRHVSYLGEIEQYELAVTAAAAPATVPPTRRPGASPSGVGGLCFKAFEQNPSEIRRVGQTLIIHVPTRDVLVLPAG